MNGKIYVITCLINNKKYVGQTIQSLKIRWNKHINCNWNKKNSYLPLQRAFKKYGIENFKMELIVDKIDNQDKLNELEIYYSQLHNSLVPFGYGLKVGERNGYVSEITRLKISKINIGRKASPETIKRLSDSHMGNKHTEETKKKISDFFKGKKPSENTRLGSIDKNSKTWKFISPNNEIVQIKNLKQFCKDNNLSYSEMYSLTNGTRISPHKGWINYSSTK